MFCPVVRLHPPNPPPSLTCSVCVSVSMKQTDLRSKMDPDELES